MDRVQIFFLILCLVSALSVLAVVVQWAVGRADRRALRRRQPAAFAGLVRRDREVEEALAKLRGRRRARHG